MLPRLLLLAAFSLPALADDAVVVTAVRDPVDKSYRKMAKGMDLFAQMRALAPQASLRFKLLPRKRSTDMASIDLAIVANTFEEPIELREDNTFVLPRNRAAFREDASVRPNRKKDTMTWRADVRTPGLPEGTRRLGDLRLECLVGMESGLVSQYPSLFDRVIDLLEDPRSFCGRANAPYLFFAEKPLFGVTLVSGPRRQTLSVEQMYGQVGAKGVPADTLRHCDCEVLLERTYVLPLGDRSWPDDTLVSFEYMDTPAPPPQEATKTEVLKAFGEGRKFRFDGGREVWAYRFDDTEFVVLLDAAGRVLKTRVRS